MAQRDYAKEYRDHGGTERAGRVSKGDGKEIDHKDFNPENNSPSNLRVVSKKTNREKQPKRS